LAFAYGITNPSALSPQQRADLSNHYYAYGVNESRPGDPMSGQPFTLTKGEYNLTGTFGNDIFSGVASADQDLKTLSVLDSIDGGAGIDTLKALSDGVAIKLGAGIKNVEIVEAQSAAALDVDSSVATGVETLNV